MANLFFDLDGTLIDSKQRLYRLFCDLTPQNDLSFDEYWAFKRDMKDHEWILTTRFGYTAEQVEEFQRVWLEKIEQEKYLELDTLFAYTVPTLTALKSKGYRLYVVTARQSERMARWQLERLGLLDVVDDYFVTQGNESKANLIKDKQVDLGGGDYFVGDTGMDVMAGHELGVHTVAVLSGFRNKEHLDKYKPKYLLADVSQLISIL